MIVFSGGLEGSLKITCLYSIKQAVILAGTLTYVTAVNCI